MFPPLLFQVVAFEYHHKVKFAYVKTKDRLTNKIQKKYSISPEQPTVMILKEEPSSPVVMARVRLKLAIFLKSKVKYLTNVRKLSTPIQ